MESLSDRMKDYERSVQDKLPENLPVIIRLDGRNFHSLTRGLKKPFDEKFIDFMNRVALDLCENEIQNVRLAFLQSDEISLLVYKDTFATSWFGNRIQKMVSIASARASAFANKNSIFSSRKLIMFDARVFVLPPKEVCNYFIWRQQDWTRNSVQMLARSLYSHKDLQNKNQSEMNDMIFQKGNNWNDLPTYLKRGRCVYSVPRMIDDIERKEWHVSNHIPVFTNDREFIEHHLGGRFIDRW